MRTLLIALLTSGAVAAPVAAQVAAAPVSNGSIDARTEAAMLAEIASPPDLYLSREMDGARRTFLGALELDPEMKAFEADHPGVSQALWDALAPEFRRESIEGLPQFRELLAGVYRRRLTGTQMQAMRTFFATSSGQKIIRAIYAPVNVEPFIADLMKNPDGKVSAQTVDALQQEAKSKAGSAVTEADAAALAALGRVVSLPILEATGADLKATLLEWINRPDAEFDARIDQLLSAAVDRFLAGEAKR